MLPKCWNIFVARCRQYGRQRGECQDGRVLGVRGTIARGGGPPAVRRPVSVELLFVAMTNSKALEESGFNLIEKRVPTPGSSMRRRRCQCE